MLRRLFRSNYRTRSYADYQTITLANGVAPSEAFLPTDGVLITFENFADSIHNGPLVAMYSKSGELIMSFELDDLYSQEVAAE